MGQACDAQTVFLVPQFDGPAREELQQVAAQFCSCQTAALGLIKAKQRKESRFQLFMQVRPRPAGEPRASPAHPRSETWPGARSQDRPLLPKRT